MNCDDFWMNVQLTMLVRGFPGTNIADFNVQPNLLKWSPYTGPNTRRGPLLINTEHCKVSGSDQSKLEKECRDITEERLVEFLTQSTALEVKKMAVSLGVCVQLCTDSTYSVEFVLLATR